MLPINTTVRDRYRIIYAVDEQPVGPVYRARDEQRGSVVLVGVLPADASVRADVERLARQVAAVRHDALLPIIEQFAEGAGYVLICDDPGGQDLERRLRGGPLPEADVLVQVRRLIGTLEALHGQRPPLVLGDLLPTDMWVGDDGAWRLAPFTLVRSIGDAPNPYRAPELLDAKVEPSAVTDTYALVALTYHALTGWPPPTAEQQQAGTPLNAPRTLNPQLSELIEQFLLRGLQQKAANRYQNARELRLALETVQMMAGRSLGLGADVLTPSSEAPTVMAATPRPLQPVPVGGTVGGQPAPPPYPTPYPPQPGQYPPQPGQYPPQPGQYSQPGQYASPPPGQPYPAGMYQAPPQKRGNGCLIAAVIVLGLIVALLCVAITFVTLVPNNPISGLLGWNRAASVPAPAAPNAAQSSATGAPVAPTTNAAPVAAQPSPIPATLGPKAITLQNVAQITRTGEISNATAGPLAFAPDGATLAIGVNDTITLRAVNERLTTVHTLSGHTGQVGTLAFAPDGKLLASGAIGDNDVRLWNPSSGQLIRALSGHTGWIRSVAFSPDGKLLASGATDNSVRLWNVESGQLVHTLNGHENWIGGIAFAPDGQRLASASRDGTVRLWDVATGQQRSDFAFQMPLESLGNFRVWATGIAFAPDGKQLAVGGIDAVVRLLDATTGAEQRQLSGHSDWIVIRGLGYTGDGKTLLSGSLDGTIRAWDPVNGTETGQFAGHRLRLSGIAVSADGATLASASDEEGVILLWDVAARQPSSSLRVGQGLITRLAYTPDGTTLGMAGVNGAMRLHSLTEGRGQLLVGAAGAAQPLAFVSNDALVVISDQGSVVRIGRGGAGSQPLAGLDGQPLAVATSDDGRSVAAGSSTGSIAVWDAATGTRRQTLQSDLKAIAGLAMSGDGALLAAAGPSNDPRIQVWDVASGKVTQTLTNGRGGIIGLAFQPRGTLLAATDRSGTLFVWDTTSGNVLATQRPSTAQQRFIGLAFSPDGAMIAAGALNGDVLFWDAATGAPTAQIGLPNGHAIALAFRPDGQQLAMSVSSENAPVYLFELK